jgi:hypothetical protein
MKFNLNASILSLTHFLVISGLILACSDNQTAGGSTDVETGGITGLARQAADSSAISGAQIHWIEIDSATNETKQSGIASATTNSEGLYTLKLPQGLYNLELVDTLKQTRTLVQRVKILSFQDQNIGPRYLHHSAQISMNLSDSSIGLVKAIYIPGTRFYKTQIQSTNIIDSLSAGVPLELWILNNKNQKVRLDSMTMQPDQLLQIKY